MITVLIIVPYPELRSKAEDALRAYADPNVRYEVKHAYGTVVEAMNLGDADIIVARGLTQKAIKRRRPEATNLELTVSAYDILRAIHECRKEYAATKIAIIGSDSILYDIDTVEEMIHAGLEVFRVSNEGEIAAALDRIEAGGFDAVVGGLTACTLARARGRACMLIPTSEETLRVSIKEAANTAQVMLNERAKAEISRSILHNSKEGIMYFDRDGVLRLFNRRAVDILNLDPAADIAGRKVEDLFVDPDIVRLVRVRREAQGVLKTVNRSLVVSDYAPVRVENRDIGVVCTFQRVNEIQAVETKIRKELSIKGLVAKYGFADIIHASSSALSGTIATAHKYADVDANVLLIGETGTGKELFAQSIHSASPRRDGPFVAVNCAAFTENLLESELFGYTDGAFTGAAKGGKTGLFELAHGGTLFLDEIGEIPMTLQATLLRALQEGEIRRIGADKVIPVNVRIIAATNLDLRQRVAEGAFRMDLLYRLDVLSLRIPPLRQRREDVAHIVRHYIAHYRLRYNKPDLELADDALEVLTAYDWPGNTRELRNVCERLVVLGENDVGITRETVANTLALADASPPPTRPPSLPAQDAPENIEQLVRLADSMRVNKADIAGMLGISRTTLWRRMKGKN